MEIVKLNGKENEFMIKNEQLNFLLHLKGGICMFSFN